MCDSAKEFGSIIFSKGVQRMLDTLRSHKLSNAQILMLLRTIGDDAQLWRYYIGVLERNEVLYPSFDVDVVVTNSAIHHLYKTVVNNGLIRDFGDSTREIDWFLMNFCEKSVICRKRKNITNLWHFIFRRSVKFFPDSYPSSSATLFNQIYDNFSGFSEECIVGTRAALEVAIGHFDYAEWCGAVYGNKEPGGEGYERMMEQVERIVDKILKNMLIDLTDDEKFEENIWKAMNR